MCKAHKEEVVRQFSQQAIPFTQVPGHLDALELLVEIAQPTKDDRVLDVACGPGIVACEFAIHSKHVTGIDITPPMIEQAIKRQNELMLENLSWAVGEAQPLSYEDESFSLVITRYSLHHFIDPLSVLTEMVRVCCPGGRILVADVAIEPAKSDAYDRLEIMRDPSHTHALTTEEFPLLFLQLGLEQCQQSTYGVEIELETQLRASFPNPGDKKKLRDMITSDIGTNALGINPRRVDDTVVYTVPISVFTGRKGTKR